MHDEKNYEQLELNLKELRGKVNLYKMISNIFLFVFVISMLSVLVIGISDNTDYRLYLIAPVAGLSAVISFGSKAVADKYKMQMSFLLQNADIIPNVLKEVFTVFKYTKNSYIPIETIRGSALHSEFNVCKGNDYLHADYYGVNFEFSDILLERLEAGGGDHNTSRTVFKGFWIKVPLGYTIHESFAIWDTGINKSGLKTFEERFKLKAENIEVALSVLTPSFQTKIMKLSDKLHEKFSGGQLFLRVKENKLYITVHTIADNFEPEINKEEKIIDMENRFRDEISTIADVLETIAVNITQLKQM